MAITLIIFTVAGFSMNHTDSEQSALFADTLSQTFNLSPWLMLVPLITAILIMVKLPTIITLFISSIVAAICILIFQPHILLQIAPSDTLDFTAGFKALMISIFGNTALATGHPEIDALVATRGMRGMMDTVWLIICAMCFGGVMSASHMLHSITNLFVRFVHKPKSAVSSTVGAGLFFNACTADQYLSIILTGNLFKELYRNRGLESRLLSRTVEDSVTVTSVLIPWNSCGMTQATVLGVGTLTYLPYCFFNLLSPLMSILVVFTGFKIKQGITVTFAGKEVKEDPNTEAAQGTPGAGPVFSPGNFAALKKGVARNAATGLCFAFMYRYITPVIATPLTKKITAKIQKRKEEKEMAQQPAVQKISVNPQEQLVKAGQLSRTKNAQAMSTFKSFLK